MIDEELWTLPEWVAPGTSFRQNFGKDSWRTKRYHILAIVDEDMVVMKWWSKRKQYWVYVVECPLFFTYGTKNVEDIKNA